MEQSNATGKNPGKGLGVSGFVLGLVGLVVGLVIYFVCAAAALLGGGMGLAIFWTILSAAGLVLSFMGSSKAKAAGFQPGLAMGGIVLGILALLLSLFTIYTVYKVHNEVGTHVDDFKNAMENLSDSLKNAIDTTIH